MKQPSRLFRRFLYSLELYEIVGIIVSLVAILAFFHFGNQLDQLRGIPGYHWEPLKWVFGVYKTFIPKSILLGVIGLFVYFLVTRKPLALYPGVALGIVRLFLPFCILLAIYRTLQFYIPLFNPHDQDQTLLAIDHWLFGVQPSVWLQAYIRPWLTEYMNDAYQFWFPLIFITILLLYLRGRKAVSEFITTSLITFYIGYITFVFVPAIGPVFTLANVYHVKLNGTIITVIQNTIDTDMTIARDCFPSLHTAISIVMLVFIYRYWRKWTWLYAPAAVSILASTIYLRAHYAIDVIAGILLSTVTVWICPRWMSIWDRYRFRQLAVESGQSPEGVPVQAFNPYGVQHMNKS